jgi:hypothetical protein
MSEYDELVSKRLFLECTNKWEAALARAKAAEAEVEMLKGVLARLGSSEAFYKARVMGPEDAELIMRMDFAQKALEAKP